MRALTARQQNILDFIKGFIAENGFPPTRREIASHCKFSTQASQLHLYALASKGKILLSDRESRGIKVVDPLVKKTIPQPATITAPAEECLDTAQAGSEAA